MSKTKFCENARKNIELVNQAYSPMELQEIVHAQFHYFWHHINLGYPLEGCAYERWNAENLKKIKKEVMRFRRNNIHIFKNQLKSFQVVILHLSLVKEIKNKQRINKI